MGEMEEMQQSSLAFNELEQFKIDNATIPLDYYTEAKKRKRSKNVLDTLKLTKVPSTVVCGTKLESRYYAYVKVKNHHFHVRVHKIKANKWSLDINLCLIDFNSDDVLIYSEKRCKVKELKELAVRFINEYVESKQCLIDIEQWKNQNRQKVYDENFNYIGVTYHMLPIELLTKEFTYYNESKPEIEDICGTFYQVSKDKETILVHKIYDKYITTREVINEDSLKILKGK